MLPRSQCEGGIMPLLGRQDHHAGWTQLDQTKMMAGWKDDFSTAPSQLKGWYTAGSSRKFIEVVGNWAVYGKLPVNSANITYFETAKTSSPLKGLKDDLQPFGNVESQNSLHRQTTCFNWSFIEPTLLSSKSSSKDQCKLLFSIPRRVTMCFDVFICNWWWNQHGISLGT